MLISTVNKGELTVEFRIDSEYYSPDNLSMENAVFNHKYEELGKLCDLIAGPFGSTVTTDRYDKYSERRYIRGKDIQSFFMDNTDPVFVQVRLFDELPQFQLLENDLLITVVGMKFGKVAIISGEDTPSIFSCKSTLIRNPRVNVWYLLAYLSCRIGYGLVRRGQRGAAQPGVNLFDIQAVPVPLFSKKLQSKIEYVIKKARNAINESSSLFFQAEKFLLSELNLNTWNPKPQQTFIKNHSDIERAGRIDAEYYQPKYDEIIKAVKEYKNGWGALKDLVTIKDRNFNPNEKQQYQYIELSNITGNGEISDCMFEEGQDLPTRARRNVFTGDLIVSSIEGSLSSIALIGQHYDQALCSTGFQVIKSKILNSETLLVLLKSTVGQLQLKRGCSGTILTAINKDEFSKLILPILSEEEQTKVQKNVIDSFNFRKQSKHLLECAKKAVEMAIEQNEEIAIQWLENETNEIKG